MIIAFEINHPAQAHLFRNVIRNLNSKGHSTRVLIKDSEVIRNILDDAGITYISLGKKGKGLIDKAARQIDFLYKIWKLNKTEAFELGVGVSLTLPLFSRISKMASVVLDDDDKKATPIFAFFAHNNANILLRPAALSIEGINRNTIYYNGLHELSYLHPADFKPDINVLNEQGIEIGESYFILRLVALQAHHDRGIRGISREMAEKIVDTLRPHGRVIITSENTATPIRNAETLRIKPSRLHDLIAFSKLVVTDGQTLCTEAACLGVPSVRINDFVGRITTLEYLQSNWQLTFGYKPSDFMSAVEKISAISVESKDFYMNQRDKLLAESIRVSEFLTWFIINYPESRHILQNDPGYQDNFK